MSKLWHNKIIGHAMVDPADLLAHPGNWRLHPKHQQDALRGAIADVGFIKSVTVNELTQHVLDGHLRVTLALRDDIPLIPVEYVSLTEAEELEALATLDPLAAMAGSDKQKLDDLLCEVSTTDSAIQQMLDDLAVDVGIIPPVTPDDMWQGMPEFEQEDQESWKKIIVHFASEDDYKAFQKLIDQPMTEKTKYIWYPQQQKENLLNYRIEDES